MIYKGYTILLFLETIYLLEFHHGFIGKMLTDVHSTLFCFCACNTNPLASPFPPFFELVLEVFDSTFSTSSDFAVSMASGLEHNKYSDYFKYQFTINGNILET